MEKVIEIDGKEVKFRATAAIPRLYRIKFGRDIMQDMKSIEAALKAAKKNEGPIPPKLLEIFEDVSYLMAKHADPDMEAKSPDEWLEGFNTFSIYMVFPQLLDLWKSNNMTLGESKKKAGLPTGK
jgi:hypothetical protein